MINKLIKFLFLFLIFTPSVVLAQTLAKFSISGIDYALEAEDGESFVFAIKSLKEISVSESDILLLENPNRLVIDIFGVSAKSSKNIAVKNSLFSAIRIGNHPDKTRIVLDIKAKQNPKFQLKKVGKGGVMLDLSFSEESANAINNIEQFDDERDDEVIKEIKVITTSTTTLKPTTSTTTSTTLAVTTTTNKTTTTTTEEEEEITTTSTLLPTTTSTTTSTTTTSTLQKLSKDIVNSQISTNIQDNQNNILDNSKVGVAVSSIFYQVTENTKLPAVAIDAPNLKSYALTKITPELYELTMEDAHLVGTHLSLPQFPPENFRGFSVVVAREEKSKVILKIFVEDGTRLFPFIANNQLWIKVAE